jgi:cysteine synthase A
MPRISDERKAIYERIEGKVGNTPLYQIKNIEVPNGCKIFCKEEYRNPTGSHYDRFWVKFLRHCEEQGTINTNMTIVETSTGNSGASFAWMCRALKYEDYHMLIPADMPPARIQQIKEYGAEIHPTTEKEYVAGMIKSVTPYVRKLKKNAKDKKSVVFLNHSDVGGDCICSLEKAGYEIVSQIYDVYKESKIDFFVSALGNGLTTKGIGSVLKEKFNTKIIGVEPEESPTIWLKKNPDANIPITMGKTHGLIGTGPGITNFAFKIMDSFYEQIDDFCLVDKVSWELRKKELDDVECISVGNTSAACLHAALELASDEKNAGANIVIIFYDSGWKYY